MEREEKWIWGGRNLVCTKNRDHEYDDDTANMYNRHGCMVRLFVSIYTFIKKK